MNVILLKERITQLNHHTRFFGQMSIYMFDEKFDGCL